MSRAGQRAGQQAPGAVLDFVTMQTPTCEWGITADCVRAIVAKKEWGGAAPLDLAPHLGVSAAKGFDDRRVIVIDTDISEVALLAIGPIALRRVPSSELLDLPFFMANLQTAELLIALVLSEGQPPLLALDASRLATLAQTTRNERSARARVPSSPGDRR